jgi:hypothetical protein
MVSDLSYAQFLCSSFESGDARRKKVYIPSEHLQQSPNTTPPIRWYWDSPISLFRFIGGDAVAVPPIYLSQRWVPQECKRKYD